MMTYIINYLTQFFYIIEGYVKWGLDELTGKASARSVERLQICKTCESYRNGICKECGCIMQSKARVDFPIDEEGKSIGGCPLRKW